MELFLDSESNRIKLEHSYAFISETLKRTKVEEDDIIVIKHEVLGETDANRVDEYFDLDVTSVAQRLKSYSRSNNPTLLSEVSDEQCEFNSQTNHLELEDNCNIVSKIQLSVPANDKLVDTDAKEILECHQNDEKMKTEENICRFCFKMCLNFKTIDGDIKGVVDVLLPGIDLAEIQEPVMCTHCEEILFLCFDFKARCFYTHDYLIPFASKKDGGAKLNLKDIYMTKNKTNISALEDQNICGFCMCPVKNGSAIFLDVGERDIMLRKTLEQCLPELDLSIIEQPVICAPCHVSLENHSRFVKNILIVEEKIKKYSKSLYINSKNQIDLSSLVQFILSEEDGGGGDINKLDKTLCDHNESVEDIDDLKCNQGQKFTPTNMLDRQIERNEIGAIKREDTFCAEDGYEFNEKNIVEVEDQKILLDQEIEIKTDEVDFNSFDDGIVMTQLSTRLNEKQECSILPNFEDNLLELHIDQTCINEDVTKITPNLYECVPFKPENEYINTHLLKNKDRSEMTIYKCLSCSIKTNYKRFLKRHSMEHKNPEVTAYMCDSCLHETIHKPQLKKHLLEHKNSSKLTVHKCDSCTYQTKRKNSLKSHLLKHKNLSEVTMHKCDSCAYQTVRKGNLISHLQKHKEISELTMYKCELCLYQSKYKSALKTHLLKHKNPSEVSMHKCDSCAYQTIHKNALKTHLLTHMNLSEGAMHKCDSCTYQTIHKGNLKSHLQKHKDIAQLTMYKCDSCLYQTKHKYELKRHLLRHKNSSEVTMYKCDSCAYQSIRKSDLKIHLLKHKSPSEVTMHKCDSCAYQTISKGNLISHLLKHNETSEVTMYKCDSCSYQSKYKSELKIHLLKHKNPSEVPVHKCDSCAYQTIRKGDLKIHLLKHKSPSEVTMHKCESCAYKTIRRGNLLSHLLKHKEISEVTMYKCDSCSYQSKYKSELKIHLLKHKNPSEVPMHKCDSCAYQTIRKGDLKIHLLKHKSPSEVTMHKCESCAYKTIRRGNLLSHLLKHKEISEVTMYKCDSCLYQSKYKSKLKAHLLKHKNP